jgi:hypothetical protein
MPAPIRAVAALLFAAASAVPLRGLADPADPYEPRQDAYETTLLVAGGSSGGTAAAITAGRLGIPTVWVVRAPRDIGGLSTNAVNPDSDLPMRQLGGLPLEYDVEARHTTGFNVGGRGDGEGYFAPFHVFFAYTRRQVDALPSVTVLSGLYPVEVRKDPRSRHVDAVVFAHRRDPSRRVVVRAAYTIDAEIEGDVTHLAGVSTTLRREGRGPSADPTRDDEAYAGRLFTPLEKIGSLGVAGGDLLAGSTQAADEAPATMAWNGSVTLEDYGKAATADSPWVLTRAPHGYDPADFAWWQDDEVYGVRLDPKTRRWNIDRFLSTVEGWRLPDGRHVLESLDIRDREANEKAHLAHVIRGLWHLQHVKKQYRYGLAARDFREGLPAKYSLADFGTATRAGDAPLPGLIYMREGRRMVNDHVFGGKLIEDDGSGRFVQKRGWQRRAAYFNAMLVDIHGVHRERRPGSGPEGMQLLRLVGRHHFGTPCIPFDVFVPRPGEATGLLVAAAGAYTHQAYAAFPRMETGRLLQGHACAVAVHHARADGVPLHEVDVRKVQLTGLELHGQSLAYLDDAIAGTTWHLIDQMLAARQVPKRNDQGVFQSEAGLTVAEAAAYLTSLFRDHAEEPAEPARLRAAIGLAETPRGPLVPRGLLLRSLTAAAGLEVPAMATQPFADVPADGDLACALVPWIERGWIAAGRDHRFEPDRPMPFSEFKRLAFHVLFSALMKTPLPPVGYRPWLVHDTFNRPDGPLARLEIGQAPMAPAAWRIEAGQARPHPGSSGSGHTTGTTDPTRMASLLVDAGTADVDVAVDLFLEQTRHVAAAGIAFQGRNARSMRRFFVQAAGPALEVWTDVLVDGERRDATRRLIPTMKRGLTLRVVAEGETVRCFLDGREIDRLHRPPTGGTLVGLVNGGEASRFDNFEVRTAR